MWSWVVGSGFGVPPPVPGHGVRDVRGVRRCGRRSPFVRFARLPSHVRVKIIENNKQSMTIVKFNIKNIKHHGNNKLTG